MNQATEMSVALLIRYSMQKAKPDTDRQMDGQRKNSTAHKCYPEWQSIPLRF